MNALCVEHVNPHVQLALLLKAMANTLSMLTLVSIAALVKMDVQLELSPLNSR
jgi:hypothetical protein